MYSKTSARAAARVSKGRSRTSSFFSVAKKLSATALSQQLPLRLMLWRMRSGSGSAIRLRPRQDFPGEIGDMARTHFTKAQLAEHGQHVLSKPRAIVASSHVRSCLPPAHRVHGERHVGSPVLARERPVAHLALALGKPCVRLGSI